MTLNQLHKQLAKLIEQGYGRRQVCIDKASFRDNRESDGCVILPVCIVDAFWVPQADDDGGAATNKDGTERGRATIVLGGSCYQSPVSEVEQQ
jgi:hypothetical protein